VTEEGRFEQVGGDGPGVDRDERIVAGAASCMQCLGDELLAGATLALDNESCSPTSARAIARHKAEEESSNSSAP